MEPCLIEETQRLRRSWDRHASEMLRDYLVADSHDPRLNLQSIQSRHFLLEGQFGRQFQTLQAEELRFATVMPWLLGILKRSVLDEELAALEHALVRGDDNAEGQPLPHHVRQVFRSLPCVANDVPIPNYVQDALQAGRQSNAEHRELALEKVLSTFEGRWRQVLDPLPTSAPKVSVLEPACGSANDYRALAACGLARHLEYVGFDLCEKNIANAQSLFPQARFSVGNIFAVEHADQSFDYTIVHDLLEHFSLAGLEQAINELCRVTRRGMFLGFFQMHEETEHLVRSVDEYHWNTLSLPRLRSRLEAHGATVQAVHVNTFVRWQLHCGETIYYDSAYSLYARFNDETSR